MSMKGARVSAETLEIHPVTGAIGAEIFGVDIGEDLSDQTISEIRQALLEHGVIFFRNQKLDAEKHKRFAARFGQVFQHPNLKGAEDPAVIEVRREPGDLRVLGESWHSDATMMAEPPMGSILYGVEIPPYSGDTLWSNQYLAYDALSSGMKDMLSGVKALHSDRKIAGPAAARNSQRSTKVREDDWTETANIHPVVRTHPETKRKCLFVNEPGIVAFEGMSEAETKPILSYLCQHASRPEFMCRFRWQAGSVAFWDNRCTLHFAVNDSNKFRRVMRRVQICGDKPY